MGYFNIFYKITRIIDMLTRKRNRKFIFILLMVIGIIFLLHNKGYCAQSDSDFTTDTSYFMVEEYNTLLDNLLFKFYAVSNSQSQMNYFNEIFNYIENGYYPYVYSYQRPSDGIIIYRIYFYKHSYNMTLFDTSLVYNDYMRVPSTGYNITIPSGNDIYQFNTETNLMAYFTAQMDYNVAIPQILLYRIPSQFIEMMQYAGRIPGNNDNEILSNVINIKQELQELNDNITDSTFDENAVDFDTTAVDNVNDTEITGLFTGVIGSFSNALNSYGGTITKIIPLPHGRTNRNTK